MGPMKIGGVLARSSCTLERLHDISCTFCGGRLEFVAFILYFIHGVFHLGYGRGLDAFAVVALTVSATEDYNESHTYDETE